jgi:late competence protein required for DNA uptake (superfamily II DNA/RNA helicase)
MKFTINKDYYESKIFQALEAGKNIVIPTMSAEYANEIYTEIADEFPNLKIALYTESSGGQEKVKLKNVR